MDYYYDIIYEIRNGKWVRIAHGEYYGYKEGWSDVLGRYICENYVWNDRLRRWQDIWFRFRRSILKTARWSPVMSTILRIS